MQQTRSQHSYLLLELKISRLERVKEIFKLALPVAFTFGLDLIIEVLNIIYAGHLSTRYLASLGLSTAFMNLFAFSPLYGVVSALESMNISSNASYAQSSQHFNTARCSVLLISLALLPLIIFCGPIFYGLGIEADMAHSITEYTRITCGGILFHAQVLLIRTHLKSQNLLWPQILVQSIITIAHILWLQLLVEWVNLGFTGICLATLLSQVSSFAILTALLYTSSSVHPKSLKGFERNDLSCSRMKEYIKPSLFLASLSVIEYWPFDLITLFIAFLGPIPLAAQTFISTLSTLLYVIPFGFVSTVSNLVASAINSGEAVLAKAFLMESFVITIIINSLGILIFYCMKSILIPLFTFDSALSDLVVQTLGFVLLNLMFDVIQASLSGGLKGIGKFKVLSIIGIIWMWVFFQPLAIGVGIFTVQKLWAVWAFLAGTMLCLSITDVILISKYDWNKIATQACAPNNSQKNEPLLAPYQAN